MPVISGRIAKLGRNQHGLILTLNVRLSMANIPLDTYLCLKVSEDDFPEMSNSGEQDDKTRSRVQHVAFQSTLPWSPPASRIGATCCRRTTGRCSKCVGVLDALVSPRIHANQLWRGVRRRSRYLHYVFGS
jgi:hypothetical protein